MKGVFDIIEGGRLSLPSRIIGKPAIGQLSSATHQHEVSLYLVVTGLGFLDQAPNRGLIENLSDRHWLHRLDNRVKALAAMLDFGLCRPMPLYAASLINWPDRLGPKLWRRAFYCCYSGRIAAQQCFPRPRLRPPALRGRSLPGPWRQAASPRRL